MIFLCVELFFAILNENKSFIQFNAKYFIISDSIIGWRNRPNSVNERCTLGIGKDTVYDVYYSTDGLGRRIPSTNDVDDTLSPESVKNKHAIFLGCSFTFGSGLSYNSTFPALFEHMYPNFKSYNYGVHGYGPNHNCLLFDEGINTINNNTVPEDSGFCLYSYIGHHLNRVYGHTGGAYKYGYPDVYVNNNKLTRKMKSERFYWFFNNSEVKQIFKINFTYPKTEAFYKRFAGIINYTAQKYWEIKPCGRFYVGLYPGNYISDTTWIRFLDPKIKVLNIPPPVDFRYNPSYVIKNDGHPTKKLNLFYVRNFSKLIVNDN